MTEDAKHVSDQHDELFHYTTVQAFESIYKSRTFWATHYEDMNDSSEFQLFRRKLGEFIRPILWEIAVKKGRDATKIDAEVDHEEAMWLDIFYQNAFGEGELRNTFICSFCAHGTKSLEAKHGLLSQWRGYGTGGGVAIVLNTRGIENLMANEKNIFVHPVNHIGKVIYDNEDEKIRADFHFVFDCLPEIIRSSYFGKELESSSEEMVTPFILGTTLVKHSGFLEEQEVRIVVSPRPTNVKSIFYALEDEAKPTKAIRYRQKGDCEIRYIELFGTAQLPIERVIVGPSRIQNINHQKIVELVKGSDIEVVKSDIPFLG